jgi:NADH:ubiquinone oxidoreductase subunit rnfD-like protein
MRLNEKRALKEKITTTMIDTLIATIPLIVVAFVVYGIFPILIILTSTVLAVLTEYIFGKFILKKDIETDFSTAVVGVLVGLSLAPFTPIYIAGLASIISVLFGQLCFGSVEKKIVNPIVIGKLAILLFFPSVLAAGSAAWSNPDIVAPGFEGVGSILLANTGMIGGYSVIAIVVGAIYLMLRGRLSWEVPTGLFISIFVGYFVAAFMGIEIPLELGEIVFLGVFILTDLYSSPKYLFGKLFYGIMIGASMILFWKHGIQQEAPLYAILILNIFIRPINSVLKPNVYGDDKLGFAEITQGLGMAIAVIVLVFAFIFLHQFGLILYLFIIYLFFGIWKISTLK